ncbi:beta-glucosidase [Oceanobacillus picturae]|uniref:Beta-glucosidase n=1 Tax=Oceanobacillus picturae TaxID=171693 RepID=A0A0U9H4X0_9BACI|nr:beta-glucosidase [Oceanobacillus picturae]
MERWLCNILYSKVQSIRKTYTFAIKLANASFSSTLGNIKFLLGSNHDADKILKF